MRTVRKLVLGETWALPIGIAIAVGIAANPQRGRRIGGLVGGRRRLHSARPARLRVRRAASEFAADSV